MWITRFTQKIEALAAKNKLIFRLASRYYNKIIKNEVDLADITKDDHILCIGGGICPFSAIMLHQNTGAKVTVIDNDSACIPEARKVISRLGIGDSVHVTCQDGCCADLSLSRYTVVHFALQVSPLESVFAQVQKRAADGTKLLIRRPKNHLCRLYSRLSLSCQRHVAHKGPSNVGSTLLYVVGDGAVGHAQQAKAS